MENHLVSLPVCLFSRLQYFFLIFHFSFSPFFLVIVLVLFWFSFHILFCISSFLSLWLHSIFFFLILSLGFLLSSILLTKSIAHFSLFSLLPFSFPFSQTFSFSQHWNTGGSHPEELERPGTHPRLKARSQPPMFHPFISAEPQFTDCVALSQHSIPGHQIALQMNITMKN